MKYPRKCSSPLLHPPQPSSVALTTPVCMATNTPALYYSSILCSNSILFGVAFNKARGHEMERENYLEDLLQRKPEM